MNLHCKKDVMQIPKNPHSNELDLCAIAHKEKHYEHAFSIKKISETKDLILF